MKTKSIVAALLLVFAAAQIEASPGYGAPGARHEQAQAEVRPDVILKEGMTKLLKFMRQQDRPNPQAIGAFVESDIAPYFDFAYMAKWAAGSSYRQMSAEQKAAAEQQVKELLLSTLVQRLGSYENQDVRFFRPRRAGHNEMKVRVGILQAGGYPASIDFRFYRSDDGWKVFDVAANGNSALSYYRQHFARQMRQQRSVWAYRR